MSLLPTAFINAAQPAYVPYTQGGGGGGGSNLPAANISTLNVSTITGTGGVVNVESQYLYWQPGSNVNQGVEFYVGGGNTTNLLSDFDVVNGQGTIGVRGYSTISGVSQIDSILTHNVNGDVYTASYIIERGGAPFSTIMTLKADATAQPPSVALKEGMGGAQLSLAGGRVVVSPPGADLAHKKIVCQNSGNIYVPAAGTATLVAGPITTIVGNAYEVKFPNVRWGTSNAAVPGPLAWNALYVDTTPTTTYVDLKSKVETSTFQTEVSYTANFTATTTAHNVYAVGSLADSAIGAITVSPAILLVRDLGTVANMTAA